MIAERREKTKVPFGPGPPTLNLKPAEGRYIFPDEIFEGLRPKCFLKARLK